MQTGPVWLFCKVSQKPPVWGEGWGWISCACVVYVCVPVALLYVNLHQSLYLWSECCKLLNELYSVKDCAICIWTTAAWQTKPHYHVQISGEEYLEPCFDRFIEAIWHWSLCFCCGSCSLVIGQRTMRRDTYWSRIHTGKFRGCFLVRHLQVSAAFRCIHWSFMTCTCLILTPWFSSLFVRQFIWCCAADRMVKQHAQWQRWGHTQSH